MFTFFNVIFVGFECWKKGHIAKECPEKGQKRAPIKAAEDAKKPSKPSVFCAQVVERGRLRQQQPNLGDCIAAKLNPKQRNSNRFQPLILEDIAVAVDSELAVAAVSTFAVAHSTSPK